MQKESSLEKGGFYSIIITNGAKIEYVIFPQHQVPRGGGLEQIPTPARGCSGILPLTHIHFTSYNITVWNISSSDEYDAWFESLDEECKEAVLERVLLLRQFGPNLPRPYSDTLHGSKKYKNLKELRNETKNHLLRVAYYFDTERNAFLLTGGDKKGKNQKKFYRDLLAESEAIIERHEKGLKE